MRVRTIILGYVGLVALALVVCYWAKVEPTSVPPTGVSQVNVPLDAENHALCQKLAPRIAESHVPEARKSEFANSLVNYRIIRWDVDVLSAKPVGDGWEAKIRVRPFLGGRAFTTHTTLETWHISKEGTMTPLNVASEPGFLMEG